MTRWFVSRHPGAKAWAKETGVEVDRWVEHLDPQEVNSGDVVMGTLPVNLAAEVCAHGARFEALCLDMGRADRGRELDAGKVSRLNGRLVAYRVETV